MAYLQSEEMSLIIYSFFISNFNHKANMNILTVLFI
nr:MAG TPA: hypothetical protein [Caudoviricetes sp.]